MSKIIEIDLNNFLSEDFFDLLKKLNMGLAEAISHYNKVKEIAFKVCILNKKSPGCMPAWIGRDRNILLNGLDAIEKSKLPKIEEVREEVEEVSSTSEADDPIVWIRPNKFFRDMKKHISKEKISYFSHSKVLWQPIAMTKNNEGAIEEALNVEPDFISNSGSYYYYCEKGVYRLSNHYNSRVASCNWKLGRPRLWADWCCSNDAPEATPHWMECLAFARWEDFKFLPEEKRDPYYFFRDSMSEEGRKAAIEAGLVSYDYDPIDDRSWTVVNCSYSKLKDFYQSI